MLGDIGHLSPIVHLLSKHGRYGRFQPCPDGLLPFPGKELGRGLGDSNFHLFLIDLLKKVKKRSRAGQENLRVIRKALHTRKPEESKLD